MKNPGFTIELFHNYFLFMILALCLFSILNIYFYIKYKDKYFELPFIKLFLPPKETNEFNLEKIFTKIFITITLPVLSVFLLILYFFSKILYVSSTYPPTEINLAESPYFFALSGGTGCLILMFGIYYFQYKNAKKSGFLIIFLSICIIILSLIFPIFIKS